MCVGLSMCYTHLYTHTHTHTHTHTDLSSEGIDNELQTGWINTLDALLNDMVSVLILDTPQHIAVQLIDEELL